jgi:O-antigen/teichoic acid export membrane protein
MKRYVETIRTNIERSPFLRRFLTAAFWSVFGSVVTNGASLGMTIVVARILGRATFGQYIAIQTTLIVLASLSFGVGYAATRYAAELHRRAPVRLGRILALSESVTLAVGLTATFALFFGSDWLSIYALNAPDLGHPLALASLATTFTSLDGFQKNVLIGMEAMRAFAVGSMIGVLASFPIMLALSYLYGLNGAAAAMVLNAVLNASISRFQMYRALKKFCIRMSLSDSLKERNVLLHFAFPGILSSLLPTFSQWTVQSMLANRPGGYDELAIFGVAMQWFHVVNFLPATTARALMPVLTDLVTDKDHRNSRRLLLLGVGVGVSTALPVALCGAFLSPYIMASYGPQFVGGQTPLMITMAVAVLHSAQTPVQNLIAAKSEMWIGVSMTAALMAVYVAVSGVLVLQGAKGVSIAFAIAYCLQMFWAFGYALASLRR